MSPTFVIPAQAGIHRRSIVVTLLDSGLRGNDEVEGRWSR
jgi:hypothetical protein